METSIKELENKIGIFAASKGAQTINILEDLLDYIIGFFDPTGTPNEKWRYDKKDNEEFYDMMMTYFELAAARIEHDGWFDAWGDLFMSLITKGGNKGQFFTPPSLCNIMSKISLKEEPQATQRTTFGKRVVISDCACGSSRNLLAAMSVFQQNGWRKPYLVAEDLDLLCCKMSAINMAVHGCFGEAICHDSLSEPDKVRLGYIVNESMWPFPTNIPSIRRSTAPGQFFCTANWLQREAVQKVEKKQNERLQLSLF